MGFGIIAGALAKIDLFNVKTQRKIATGNV